MDEQDGRHSYRENNPVAGRHENAEPDVEFGSAYQREVYSDAHYEPAGESTVPPRYYTPPEKSPREIRPNRQRRSGGKAAGVVCAVLAAGLLGGACGAGLCGYRFNNQMTSLEQRLNEYESALQETREAAERSLADAEHASAVRLPENTLLPSEIYSLATRQVVGIRTEVTMTNFFGMTSSRAVSGSGFIISEDGYILTNYHVVEDAYSGHFDIEVITYDGTKYSASIVGVEPANDIAVLKIDADGLTPAKLGDSDGLRVGDMVYAVGNPLGELEFSMSTGYVSALDRVINTQESESINMFQIDAAVNEGNSGGPLYASDGSVVGIVTAKYSSSGVEGLGFAIPVNDVRTIADDLINKGYVTGKAYMGVSLDNRYNSMYSQYYGMPLGAYIAGVTPGSAAEKAGIQAGDIITAVGDYPVNAYDELKLVLRHFSANDTTEVSVYRSGAELKLTITFDEATPENS
jgi:serine protease Do